MSIILLRGFSNSGKDYVGQILSRNYGYHRVAFADSLKQIVSNNFNCPLELLHSQEGKLQICHSDSLKRTYRQILIDEALRMRNIESGVFAKHCCEDMKHLNCNKFIITDWRYSNELDIIREYFPNYIITPVHIQRINQLQSPINDISEYQLMSRVDDFIIQNNMDDSIIQQINSLILHITNNF